MKQGLIVAFDGPNGSGKSTIIKQVKTLLEIDGYQVLVDKEPTNTSLGKFCKKIANSISGKTLAYIVIADRFEHSKRLSNLINEYDVILLDRYYFSSFIFQCIDGLSKDDVYHLNDGILMPDIQFVLKATLSLINERLSSREKKDRFEKNYSSQEIMFTEQAIDFFIANHQDITIHVIESSSNLHDEVNFENSINVYHLLKEKLHNA